MSKLLSSLGNFIASRIKFNPYGNLTASNVQSALQELNDTSIGEVKMFLTENVPNGFLLLSGENRVSTFDPAVYPKLYERLGTNQLPDCTDRFPEGAGNRIAGGSVKAWRLPSSVTVSSGGSHGHTGSTVSAGAHTHTYKSPASASNFNSSSDQTMSSSVTATTSSAGAHTHTVTINDGGDHSHTLSVPAENQDTYLAPDAFGVYWAIKAK